MREPSIISLAFSVLPSEPETCIVWGSLEKVKYHGPWLCLLVTTDVSCRILLNLAMKIQKQINATYFATRTLIGLSPTPIRGTIFWHLDHDANALRWSMHSNFNGFRVLLLAHRAVRVAFGAQLEELRQEAAEIVCAMMCHGQSWISGFSGDGHRPICRG